MAQNQTPKQNKKNQQASGIGAIPYIAILAVVSVFLYSTLFTKAYAHLDIAADTDKTAQAQSDSSDADTSTQTDSTDASSVTEPTADDAADNYGLEFTIYPDTGETVATVMLDAGHGDYDGGSVSADGTMEKDVNLAVVQKVAAKLREINPQINVILTREGDETPWADNAWDDLLYRTDIQESSGADYFFSFHCNSNEDTTVDGYMFFINTDDPVEQALTDTISEYIDKAGWTENFGTLYTNQYPLAVVSMSPIHSTLLEMGFMTNEDDMKLLNDEASQQRLATAIAAGISEYIMANPEAPKYESSYLKNMEKEKQEAEQSETPAADSSDAAKQ